MDRLLMTSHNHRSRATLQNTLQRWLTSVCLALLVTTCGLLTAQANSGDVEQGKLLYNAQEYTKATAAFRKALTDKASTVNDRIGALKHLGLIAVILRKPKAARRYFLKLLQLNPKFKLDSSTSPKLVKGFNVVKKEFDAKSKVTLQMLSPAKVPSAQPLELRLKATDSLQRIREVVLWHRIENDTNFTRRVMREVKNPGWQSGVFKWDPNRPTRCAKPLAGKSAAATSARYYTYTLPKFVGRTRAYNIEYYIQVKGADQAVLAGIGSAKKPNRVMRTVTAKKITPIKPKATPIYKKWWLWTIVSVAVAGGVVAVVVATLPKAPPTPETGGAIITILKPTY